MEETDTLIKLLLRFWDIETIRRFHAAAGQVLIERQREELPPRFMISEE